MWECKKLEDVCSIIGGGTPSKQNKLFYNGTIPWATIRDMNVETLEKTEHSITQEAVQKSATNIIPKNSVIIASRVGLGKVCILKRKTAINQDIRAIIPKSSKEINTRYLFRWFQSIEEEIKAAGKGMTVKGITLPFIKSLIIPLPPLPEQKRIVTILDEAFEGIDATIANTQANLAAARELFESYLNKTFTQKHVEYTQKTLNELCTIKPPKKEAKQKISTDDLVSFVPMNDLGECKKTFVARQERKLSEVAGSYTYFADNDVLLAKITPCFENGKLGIARNLRNGIGFGSSEYVVLRSKGEIKPEYLFYFLTQESFRARGAKVMTGAVGHKRIPKEFVEQCTIPVPSLDEQSQTIAILDELSENVQKLLDNYQQKLTALNELKQSILAKAFRGELTTDEVAA